MKHGNELIGAYIPVIQQGYVELFDRHPEATVGVFDTDILSMFDYLRKDVRALSPEHSLRAVEGLGRTARFLGQTAIRRVVESDTDIYFADDDVSHGLLEALEIPESRVMFEPVFLRWDRTNTSVDMEIEPDGRIGIDEVDPAVVRLLRYEQTRSTNAWRQVAAVATRGGNILRHAHNHSLPTDYSGMIDADPRNTSKRGQSIELSTDIHAESELVAKAARSGQSLEHADIYVTTFPCPNCSKLLAMSGIDRCFYASGYAMLDGQTVMKAAGIDLIKMDGFEAEPSDAFKPYRT